MYCSTFREIRSTERSLQLAVQSKTVGFNQLANDVQPKGLFRRFRGWVRRGFRPKRRHQTNGPTIEKQYNHLNEVSEYRPVGANTFAESCVGSDGNADDTEPTHTDISSLRCQVTPLKVQMDKGSERTTPLLTHRLLNEATDSMDLKATESSAPVMAGCVDTLRGDSRGAVRSVSARRSDRIADSIHAERDQSFRSQRDERQQRNHRKHQRDQSSFNGADKREGSHSDLFRFEVKSASAVRVEVSDNDIRVIADDSIVPTDGHIIQGSRKRESKLKLLLKNKGFVKVKSDGEHRYVRKAIGRTLWNRIKRSLCLKVADSPHLRLEAQEGREDLNNKRVHKSIRDQHVGRKRNVIPVMSDTPLRRLESFSPESKVKIISCKKEWSSEKLAQFEALKESLNDIRLQRELTRVGRMDISEFATQHKKKGKKTDRRRTAFDV